MRSRLLQVLALLPIPLVVALVVWAGRRPQPHLQLPVAKHAHKGGGPRAVELPPSPAKGWQLQGAAVRYDEKSLFDRIDGAAPVYIRAGFVYSLGGEYKRQGAKEPIIVDLYDMGTTSRALGMYATERDASYRFIRVGDEGYLASGSLNFWRGRFYAKLAGQEQGEAMDRDLEELARALAAKLPAEKGAAAELAPLALLPAEDRLEHGRGYSHPPLGDVDGLAATHYQDYKQGEQGYRLFARQGPDAASRYAAAKAYFQKDKAKAEESEVDGTKVLSVTTDGATTLLLLRGQLLLGAIDLQGAELAPTVRTRLLAAIAKGKP